MQVSYKLMNSGCFFNFCFLIFFTQHSFSRTIDTLPQAHQLHIINNGLDYLNQIKSDANNEMVDIQKIIPDIKIKLAYASPENFTHTKLYPTINKTFLRKPVALALKKVQDSLRKQNLSLLIWDAYRPYSVTKKMWELVHDDRYVANPSKGSGHNRGIAVDLTIISLRNGKELDMGTGFDNFTDSAHQGFIAFPESVLINRNLLRELMRKSGFTIFDTEWWHYYFAEKEYDVMDISFEDFIKYASSKTTTK